MKRPVAWAIALILPSTAAFAADLRGVITTPVATVRTTNVGQELVVPDHPTAVVSQTTIPVGARTPAHKHPYLRFVYVLDGTLTVVDEATGRTFEVGKGGFLPEMIGRWHHGENRGRTPVRLIAIDQVPEGVTTNTIMRPAR